MNESSFKSDIVAGTTGPIERSVQIPKFYKETNYGTDATLNRRVKIPSDPSSNVTTIDNKCLHIGLRE